MTSDIDARLTFAHTLADAASAEILPRFRKQIEAIHKGAVGGFDPVTKADHGAEQAMRMLIRENYPDDGIIGEEYGDASGENDFVWVLDPLDGTRAFIAGQPLWGTLIALEQKGRRVFGILEQPFLRERFVGANGHTEMRSDAGTHLLRTRECPTLAQAIIGTTHPFAHMDESERALFRRVEEAARMSRYGGDCYAYALLAMGCIDLVMEARLAHWDVAALLPIVEGAGGIVTDWRGEPVKNGGDVLASGDKRTHAEALAIIG